MIINLILNILIDFWKIYFRQKHPMKLFLVGFIVLKTASETLGIFWRGGTIVGTGFSCLISLQRFSFFLMTSSEKCLAQTKLQFLYVTAIYESQPKISLLPIFRQCKNCFLLVACMVWKHPGTLHLLTILIPSWYFFFLFSFQYK